MCFFHWEQHPEKRALVLKMGIELNYFNFCFDRHEKFPHKYQFSKQGRVRLGHSFGWFVEMIFCSLLWFQGATHRIIWPWNMYCQNSWLCPAKLRVRVIVDWSWLGLHMCVVVGGGAVLFEWKMKSLLYNLTNQTKLPNFCWTNTLCLYILVAPFH